MGAPIGNKYALGNNGGQPPMFATPKELEQKIEEYFEYAKGESREGVDGKTEVVRPPEIITVTGIALYLGFSDRRSFYDYGAKNEFAHIIKRARLVVENRYEQGLNSQACTGSIFALKNMGWIDKTELVTRVGKDAEDETYE